MKSRASSDAVQMFYLKMSFIILGLVAVAAANAAVNIFLA